MAACHHVTGVTRRCGLAYGRCVCGPMLALAVMNACNSDAPCEPPDKEVAAVRDLTEPLPGMSASPVVLLGMLEELDEVVLWPGCSEDEALHREADLAVVSDGEVAKLQTYSDGCGDAEARVPVALTLGVRDQPDMTLSAHGDVIISAANVNEPSAVWDDVAISDDLIAELGVTSQLGSFTLQVNTPMDSPRMRGGLTAQMRDGSRVCVAQFRTVE